MFVRIAVCLDHRRCSAIMRQRVQAVLSCVDQRACVAFFDNDQSRIRQLFKGGFEKLVGEVLRSQQFVNC